MIVAGMIVGPGEANRWLDFTLRHAKSWADRLVVAIDPAIDEDSHMAVCDRADWVQSCATSFVEDESAMRNALLAGIATQASDGDLVVIIDADERLVFTGHIDPRGRLKTMSWGHADVWTGQFVHLWDPACNRIRVDGGWAPGPQTRIYRHRRVTPPIPGRRLACQATPHQPGSGALSGLTFVHYGYARVDDRRAKYERYAALDGGRFHSGTHITSILDMDPELAPWPS